MQAPEQVSGDSKIISVDEIKTVFEKMIIIINDWVNPQGGTDNHLKIDIDKMELGLVRVVSQNNEDEGLLIPAWVFYGTQIYTGSAGGITPEYTPQIIINAIDGSIVDMSLGY